MRLLRYARNDDSGSGAVRGFGLAALPPNQTL